MLKLSFIVRLLFFHFIIFICIPRLVFAQESTFDYKLIVHTFNEAWNTGNYDLLDQVVHPKYFKQEGDQKIVGIEPLKVYVKNFRNSMPDAKITYIDEVYGSEKAAILFTLEGTPVDTGKKFKAEGIVIFRFVEGKIIEDKSVFDQLSSLKQQGYTIVTPLEK